MIIMKSREIEKLRERANQLRALGELDRLVELPRKARETENERRERAVALLSIRRERNAIRSALRQAAEAPAQGGSKATARRI